MAAVCAPDSICLLRLSAIGDATHVVPVIRALQAHWPDTELTWVVGKTEHSLVGDLDGVDFVVVDKRDGLFGAVPKLRAELAGRRFDLLLHLQASWRANLLSTAIRAQRRIGFDRPRGRNGQRLFTNACIEGSHRVHVLDGFFQFLRAVGIAGGAPCWQLPVPSAAAAQAEQWLCAGRRYLAISPCSSMRARNFRNWSADRYAAVADHAYRHHSLELVLTGGSTPLERSYAEAITAQTAAPTIDLVGRTSLKELLAVLGRAALFIGPDSGPLHMANAAGTPVIGLYATSNPQRTGPYCHLERVANRYPEAAEAAFGRSVDALRWGQRVRAADAMERITVAEVVAQIDRVMGAF